MSRIGTPPLSTDHSSQAQTLDTPSKPVEENKPVQSRPLLVTPNRRPVPFELRDKQGKRRKQAIPLASTGIDEKDLEPLSENSTEQITMELMQLYLILDKKLQENGGTLELRNGLKALEDHIRLLEHVHVGRTTLVGD